MPRLIDLHNPWLRTQQCEKCKTHVSKSCQNTNMDHGWDGWSNVSNGAGYMIEAQALVIVLPVLVATAKMAKNCSRPQCSEGSQPRQEDHGSAGCQGSQPTQEEMAIRAREDWDDCVEAGDDDPWSFLVRQVPNPRKVAPRPPLMFQYLETQGTWPFWQMVDDRYQQSLSDCCGDSPRTLNFRDKCATPGCFRLRVYPQGSDRDRCCKKGRDTGCTEHDPECDDCFHFLGHQGLSWRQDTCRTVRKVQVTIVDHKSQKLKDENEYDYNLWWQYEDDRGWKNFDPEVNKNLLDLMQKPHERECSTSVLAWDRSRGPQTQCNFNFLEMIAISPDKQWPMRLVMLEAYG